MNTREFHQALKELIATRAKALRNCNYSYQEAVTQTRTEAREVIEDRVWVTKVATKHFTVEVADGDLYGYFEHDELGDSCGGGLWFEARNGVLALTDYDGVPELPSEVVLSLRGAGYIVDEEFE